MSDPKFGLDGHRGGGKSLIGGRSSQDNEIDVVRCKPCVGQRRLGGNHAHGRGQLTFGDDVALTDPSSPGNPLVDAIGTVNVGTVTILSNASLGFDLTIAAANTGSALVEDDGGPTTIPYQYYLEFFYGVLAIATPTGPFAPADAMDSTTAGGLIAFRSVGQPSTNVTYGVQLVLDTSTAVDGIYVDTLTFTLTDD